jgi:hypothetical protein
MILSIKPTYDAISGNRIVLSDSGTGVHDRREKAGGGRPVL